MDGAFTLIRWSDGVCEGPNPPVVCGTAAGTTVGAKPVANLCSDGSNTAVNFWGSWHGTRYWNWNCGGNRLCRHKFNLELLLCWQNKSHYGRSILSKKLNLSKSRKSFNIWWSFKTTSDPSSIRNDPSWITMDRFIFFWIFGWLKSNFQRRTSLFYCRSRNLFIGRANL